MEQCAPVRCKRHMSLSLSLPSVLGMLGRPGRLPRLMPLPDPPHKPTPDRLSAAQATFCMRCLQVRALIDSAQAQLVSNRGHAVPGLLWSLAKLGYRVDDAGESLIVPRGGGGWLLSKSGTGSGWRWEQSCNGVYAW